MDKDIINCYKCINYKITWDKKFPRGCKLFGFKTAKNPSQVVWESTGEKCQNYSSKTT